MFKNDVAPIASLSYLLPTTIIPKQNMLCVKQTYAPRPTPSQKTSVLVPVDPWYVYIYIIEIHVS